MVYTLVPGLVCAPVLLAPPAIVRRFAHLWLRGLLWLLRVITGASHAVKGRLPESPMLVLARHQSQWETLLLFQHIPKACFVLKREILWIPVFGWYLARCNMLPINRAQGAEALRKILGQASQLWASGHSIILFPEGTRTPFGQPGPWRSGAHKLWQAAQGQHIPIVPVALDTGRIWPARSWRILPERTTLWLLPTVTDSETEASVKARIEARSDSGCYGVGSAGSTSTPSGS